MSSVVSLVIRQMYVAQAILPLLDYPLPQRDDNVRALPPQAVRSSLDISSTMLYLHQAIWSVIMPHMKQASSLAIAIFATLLRFPFPSTIL